MSSGKMSKKPNVQELVSKLRQSLENLPTLEDNPELFKNDETLIRYLKSRDWDVMAAEKMLRKTVNWRIQYNPQTIQCDYCHSHPGAHTLVSIS
ncbi:hypothetical protein PHET_04845 [Paragonimus heterotremus]|uniref:CRAL/TRIO N-terminal domain-containing protein n=1 Tax=Paragonimus heterotremus TaxID=100268 RepID=A0A8J4TBQ2_9TREM|nr:hypothetical protein PHET_04845 [Paragonimus heterotremus]